MTKSTDQMIQELYTVVIGVPQTEQKGVVGDIREIKSEIRRINGCVQSNTAWRRAFCFIIPGLATAIGFIAGKIFV